MKTAAFIVLCVALMVTAPAATVPDSKIVGSYHTIAPCSNGNEFFLTIQSDGGFAMDVLPPEKEEGAERISYRRVGRWIRSDEKIVLVYADDRTTERYEIADAGLKLRAIPFEPFSLEFIRDDKSEANQRLENNAGMPPPSSEKSTADEHRLRGVSQP